jgi:solute carrier family 25 folate transporter 32
MCTTSAQDSGAYRGLLDGLTQIARKEGLRGLYRGMVPALFGVSHGAVQFMAYEEMKKWRIERNANHVKENLVRLVWTC